MAEAVRTTCAYCGVGCGIRATVTGERKVEMPAIPIILPIGAACVRKARISAKR